MHHYYWEKWSSTRASKSRAESTLHPIMIKMASFYVKIITHYLTQTTLFPLVTDDSSSIYLFLSQRLGITIFLYVAMVTGLALNWYSAATEAWIPAGPGGLQTSSNSCPHRGRACSCICLLGLCLWLSSPPTSKNVSFYLRTTSAPVTLWRTSTNAPATGRFTHSAGGLNCAASEWAVECCSGCHVSKWFDTWTKSFRLVPQSVSESINQSYVSQCRTPSTNLTLLL